jgi:hypothetical protein
MSGSLSVDVWEERDRLHIHVTDEKGNTVAEWWDDEAREMFEDGFFIRGKRLVASVLTYIEEIGTGGGQPA